MAKYLVPVTYEVVGHITVEADDQAQAINLAKRAYKGPKSIEMPCVDVDFAIGEDESSVELDIQEEE